MWYEKIYIFQQMSVVVSNKFKWTISMHTKYTYQIKLWVKCCIISSHFELFVSLFELPLIQHYLLQWCSCCFLYRQTPHKHLHVLWQDAILSWEGRELLRQTCRWISIIDILFQDKENTYMIQKHRQINIISWLIEELLPSKNIYSAMFCITVTISPKNTNS